MLVECIHVCVGVIRVFVAVEGGVGFHYFAYLCGGPLVPGLSAQYVRPGDPAFWAVGILCLVEPGLGSCQRAVFGKGVNVRVGVVGVFIHIECGV